MNDENSYSNYQLFHRFSENARHFKLCAATSRRKTDETSKRQDYGDDGGDTSSGATEMISGILLCPSMRVSSVENMALTISAGS
jgi:hypothetical protein